MFDFNIFRNLEQSLYKNKEGFEEPSTGNSEWPVTYNSMNPTGKCANIVLLFNYAHMKSSFSVCRDGHSVVDTT